MKFIFFVFTLMILTLFANATGTGAGGGGSDIETKFMTAAWDAINSINKNHLKDPQVQRVVDAIKKMLNEMDPSKTLKIEEVSQLKTCDHNNPISGYDAWGCEKRIQLLSSFNFSNYALIFHELTRATPGLLNVDEGMRLSIGKLKLNTGGSTEVVIVDSYYSKTKYTFYEILSSEKTYLLAGAIATRVIETDDSYIIRVVWSVLRSPDDIPQTIKFNFK